MSQATRRPTAWHRPRRRWLHPEPDDLREAAHANGAPVTRAESALRRSGGTLDTLRYVVRAGFVTDLIRLAAWVPRGSQLA